MTKGQELDALAQRLVGRLLRRVALPAGIDSSALPARLYVQVREVLLSEGAGHSRRPSIDALSMATFVALLTSDQPPRETLLPSLHRAWEESLEEERLSSSREVDRHRTRAPEADPASSTASAEASGADHKENPS